MSSKKIGIVTINYNNAAGLERTLESVMQQSFRDVDYVLIDGGSNDGSMESIEKHKGMLSYYCSEKDKGIYDAQNKGILRSNGEYLLFLNSGDTLAETDFLETASLFLEQHPNHAFVYCNTLVQNKDGSVSTIIQPEQLDLFFFYTKTLNHQSCLIRRDLFTEYGLYDLRYRICADFDFILHVFTANKALFKHLNVVAAVYDNSGFSADTANYPLVKRERQQILSAYITKEQLAACEKQERTVNGWRLTLKNRLYANPLTYAVIKAYVKFKSLF